MTIIEEFLEAVFSVGPAPRPPGRLSEFSCQGRLRRDGSIIELTVDKSSVAGNLLDTNDLSKEAEESLLLEAIAKERLVKTEDWKSLSGCYRYF
jgi:hypothetical protein